MKTFPLSTASLILFSSIVNAQNLVVNPGAEDLPRGNGWTIVSSGPNACAVAPSNTFLNWTMAPDNSGNYPAAHGGTRTFFSGCSTTVPGGPFEIYQNIDLTSSAAVIDAGGLTTTFTGYIQTPINPQPDAGRFIVEFRNASNVVLGASYNSGYQSNSGGSGIAWNVYMNTRVAPAGTRSVRIRLQTTVATAPAINAYFDDISFTVLNTLPVNLSSFKGESVGAVNVLQWTTAEEINTKQFIIERSSNNSDWSAIGSVAAAGNSSNDKSYAFRDESPLKVSYYRLIVVDIDGSKTSSQIIRLNKSAAAELELKAFPNPVHEALNLSIPHAEALDLKIYNSKGLIVLQKKLSAQNNHTISTSGLSAGVYFLVIDNGKGKTTSLRFSKR